MILKEQEDDITSLENGIVTKTAKTETGKQLITNAVRFLRALQDTPNVPQLLDYGDNFLRYYYVEETPVQDENTVRRNCIHALLLLLNKHIVHSDLTRYNYIIHKDTPVFIDWGEARFVWEDTCKRAGMDADWFYPSLVLPDTTRIWSRWRIIREYIKKYRGYGTLVDLGTLYGDFVALATSDGLRARGYDAGEFDSECIYSARRLWSQYGCEFYSADITTLTQEDYRSEVTLLLSVWTYVVNKHGIETARDFLQSVINSCEVLFFENHTTGDGFVQPFITENYIENMLKSMASQAEPLARLPVAGRNASRILWKVIK